MKLILNDTKITNVRELINANLTNDNDKDCDFVITQECLSEVAKIVSEFNVTIDRLKQIEKLISDLPSIESAHQEEVDTLSKAGDILTKNPPLTRKIIDEVDRTLAKSGIHRQTVVEDDGTITWPKDTNKENYNNEMNKLILENKVYLCTSNTGDTYFCRLMKDDVFNDYCFREIGLDGAPGGMRWKMTAFKSVVETDKEEMDEFLKVHQTISESQLGDAR